MDASVVALLFVVSAAGQSSYGGVPAPREIDYQKEVFKAYWGQDLCLKFEDIPTEGKVPEVRVPYSGHDYPDNRGGTTAALAKYDRAYHGNRMLATDYERRDIGSHKRGPYRDDEGMPPRRGLFGGLFRGRDSTPTWYGHCNGWTAATIRHAEPQHSVVKNGVVFTPADIKGLLAELYMYSQTEFLGGLDPAINPATFHLVVGNWLGRGSHPIGVESAIGEVVVNYPAFSYKANFAKVNARQVDVRMNLMYAVNTPREQDVGPKKFHKYWSFHYSLDLDSDGNITAGRYYGDSNRIDMLWTPLKPAQGGTKDHERGNPHLSAKEVLALWRASVSEETRSQWLNIDPTDEDRVLSAEEEAAASTISNDEKKKLEMNAEGVTGPDILGSGN